MRHFGRAIALVSALLALAPAHASAQPSPDFLFGSPKGMIGVRSGWVFARADSALFTFVQEHLTLERKDFNAPAIGVDAEIAMAPRVSAIVGFDYARRSKNSEYRDFVDNQRLPITQTTRLTELTFSGSVKLAVTPRGREISSRAFIPAAATPYVGAGAGILHYEFLQFGDFIDVNTANLEIFAATLRSSSWTPSAHVFGGVDVKVWRRMYISGEARYVWANATPGSDFAGKPLDLAGLKTTVGLHYLF